MSLEARIDELYRLPLSEFTAARNALARTLQGDDGKRVRALAKPTLVPWAVNQLFWKARPVYDRLMKSGQALRAAQLAALHGPPAGKGSDARRAAESHRTALAEAVGHAARLAAADGARPDADDLSRTLESLSLAATRPEPPGRLTEAMRPAGFEALAGVSLPSPSRSSAEPARPPSRPQHGPDGDTGAHPASSDRREAARRKAEARAEQKREAELAARRRQLEADVASAERDLDRAKAAEAKAREALERAEQARDAARERLAAARKLLAGGF